MRLGVGRIRGRVLTAMPLLLLAVGAWQAGAALAQPNTGKTIRSISPPNSRPLCKHGYHLRGNQGRGFSCSRSGHHKTKPHCRGHYSLRSHRVGFICVRRHTATPAAPSGSITNVQAIGGRIQATYTASFNVSAWFAAADQVSASQACRYDSSHLTYVGAVRAFGTEAATTTFSPAYTGAIRICLYAYYAPQAHLVAETTFTAPATSPPAPPHPTPRPEIPHTLLTVANICNADPGLGAWEEIDPPVSAYPGLFWDANGDHLFDFAAVNFRGDNTVDVAFVWGESNGHEEVWLGFCAPYETPWISKTRFEAELSQTNAQPLQVYNAYSTYQTLYSGQKNPWVTNAPAMGVIAQGRYTYNTGGACGDISSDCTLDGFPI